VLYQDTDWVVHASYPEYLRGRGPDDFFRKNVPVTNSAGEKRIKVIVT